MGSKTIDVLDWRGQVYITMLISVIMYQEFGRHFQIRYLESGRYSLGYASLFLTVKVLKENEGASQCKKWREFENVCFRDIWDSS